MHRALLLPEIRGEILSWIAAGGLEGGPKGNAELAALGVVSRVFSQQALDLLWAMATPSLLVKLMLMHLPEAVGPRSLIAEQLLGTPFHHYSQRVRILRCYGHALKSIDHETLRVFQRHQTILFPNLRGLSLDFRGSNAEVTQIMWDMVTPSITTLVILLTEDSTAMDDDTAISLARRCSGITYFRSLTQGQQTTARVRLVCSLLTGSRHLQHVRASHHLTSDVVLHLAALPHLHTMQIAVSAYNTNPPLQLPVDCFPSMQYARILDFEPGAPFVLQFLAKHRAQSLRNVDLTVYVSPDKWVNIVRHLGVYNRLVALQLYSDDDHDLPDPSQGSVNVLEALNPLTQLPLLEEIKLPRSGPWRYMSLSELDLLRMVSHWPRLRSWTARTAGVSLEGFLRILALCPQLVRISATVVCSVLPPEDLVAQVEAQDHPFTGGRAQCLLIAVTCEPRKVARVLQRTVSRPRFVHGEQPQQEHNESDEEFHVRRTVRHAITSEVIHWLEQGGQWICQVHMDVGFDLLVCHVIHLL